MGEVLRRRVCLWGMVGGWEGGACGGWDCFGVGEGWKDRERLR